MDEANTTRSDHFCFIEICLPKKKGSIYAKVSPEDYNMLASTDFTWRLNHSGYPISVRKKDGRVDTTYMHKLVYGDSCRHLNGDKLDNRRHNLVKGLHQTKAELKMKQIIDIEAQECLIPSTDPALKDATGFRVIQYTHDKVYTGHIDHGIPHGYGVLNMEHHKQLVGEWKQGRLETGCIMTYEESFSYHKVPLFIPSGPTPFKVEVVQSGYISRPH